MNCSDAREQLSALLDAGAPAGLQGELTDHVDGCVACRAELEALAAAGELVHRGLRVAEAAAPDGYFDNLWPQINKRLEEEPQGRDAMSMSMSESGKGGPDGPTNGAVDDKSGLHDIRDLARNTLERRAQTQPEEVDEQLMDTSSPVSLGQVVLPKRAREITSGGSAGRRSVLPLIIGGVLVASLGAAAAVVVLKTMESKSDQETPGMIAATNAGGVTVSDPGADVIGGGGPAAEAKPEVNAIAADEVTADDDDGDSVTAAPDKTAGSKADKGPARTAKKPRDRKGRQLAARKGAGDKKPAVKKPAARKAAAKAGGGGKKDEIDNLLDVAAFGGSRTDDSDSGGGGGGPDLPKKLSRSQVTTTLRKLNSRVQRCYHRLKQKGTVQIKLKINSTGHVGSAKATGKFGGTPTGSCVSKVVRSAKFPRFSGPSMSLTYPFLLI